MADETHVTEKVYCYDHPSAYSGGNNALCAALMANQNKGMSASDMMALMNGGGNWNNNPFIWLIFMAWMNGGNGFWNNRGSEGDLSRQLQTIQGTVVDNHNNDLALQAINGSRDAMGQLAQTFNTDFNSIQQAICSVKSAIESVSGAIGYTSESVKNAIALGDSNIMSKICECCNTTQQNILKMGYESQLATERQTGILGSKIDAFSSAVQLENCKQTNALERAIENNRQAIVSGFSQIGYQMAADKNEILRNNDIQTQRILDQMCANTNQQLRDTIAEKDRQLQTQSIINQMKSNGCGCGC